MLGKVFIMAGQKSEYNTEEFNNHNSDKSESGCHIIEDYETYSEEIEMGKKKVKLIVQFPSTVDPKDANQFEQMLKSICLRKIQTGSLQSGLSAVRCPTPREKGEVNHE
jgi:hypothetical protein